MGDVHDGDPVGGQGGDGTEQVVDLVRVEGGGRLVHHDQPYVVGERARHGDDLLLGGGEGADAAARVDLGVAEPLQEGGGPGPLPAAPYDEARGGRLVTEEDVLRDGQPFHEVEFLVDGGDTQAHRGDRRSEPDRLAPPGDLPAVGLVDPGEHLDEGGLARAVLAEQAVDFTGQDFEIDAIEGADAGKRLGDAGHREQRWFWCHDGSPRRFGR